MSIAEILSDPRFGVAPSLMFRSFALREDLITHAVEVIDAYTAESSEHTVVEVGKKRPVTNTTGRRVEQFSITNHGPESETY